MTSLSHGLVIGRYISLIAHDDRLADMLAESFDPPLTAAKSSIGAAVRRVVEFMINQSRDKNAHLPSEVWPVDLVVRASTGPAPRP